MVEFSETERNPIGMDERQDSASGEHRRRASVGDLRNWQTYVVGVPLAVLFLPVVLVMAVVHIVAGQRLADRLFDAADRRLGGATNSALATGTQTVGQREQPEQRRSRSTYERLYEAARVFALVAAAAWIVQRWQGWPVFDYVSMAAVAGVSTVGGYFLARWAHSRWPTSGAAAS